MAKGKRQKKARTTPDGNPIIKTSGDYHLVLQARQKGAPTYSILYEDMRTNAGGPWRIKEADALERLGEFIRNMIEDVQQSPRKSGLIGWGGAWQTPQQIARELGVAVSDLGL